MVGDASNTWTIAGDVGSATLEHLIRPDDGGCRKLEIWKSMEI